MHPATAQTVPDTLIVSHATPGIVVRYHAPLIAEIVQGHLAGAFCAHSIADSLFETRDPLSMNASSELSVAIRNVYRCVANHSPSISARQMKGVKFAVDTLDEAASIIAAFDVNLSYLWDLVFNKYYSDIKIAAADNFQGLLADFRSAKRSRWHGENISTVAVTVNNAMCTGSSILVNLHNNPTALLLCKPYRARALVEGIGETVDEFTRTKRAESLLTSIGIGLAAVPVQHMYSITAAQLMGHTNSSINVVNKDNFLERIMHAIADV